jgi:hypothetical protein
MMRFNMIWILSLVGSFILFACNGDSDDSNNISESQVTFVDNGAVVSDPISTTIIISSDSIEYSTSQSGTIIGQWSKQIQSSDYDSVQQIIDDYDLLQADNITLDEGQTPCEGWGGMTITIDQDDSSHSLDISGGVCSREQWPEGIRALVDLKDVLVAKYQ